jgi:GEVED domain
MIGNAFRYGVLVALFIAPAALAGPIADYGDAPDPAYPSLFNSVGPYHVDKDREWLGPGLLSTTTTELDSKQIDLDNDDGAPYYLSGPGGNWIHATVSYNPSLSFATDNRYLNVLVDANNDGLWSSTRPEWLVRNYNVRMDTLPGGITTAEVFVQLPAGADPASLANRTTRLTLSNTPVPNGSGAWGALTRGETEDYVPTDRGGNGGIGGTGSTVPVNPPIGGGPGIGPKTTSLTENGVGKWILKAPWDACSHGTGGARTPVAPAPAANLYDWQMNVPNNVTAGPFVTFAGAPGEPHAGESGLDIAFETPPAVIIQGQINTWTGWYRCGGAPCHDGRTATYSVTYDPDGIYFIVSNDNGVPYDPAYDAPSGTPSSGSDYGHDIAMFAIPAIPEPGTAGLVAVASMLALPRLRRRS